MSYDNMPGADVAPNSEQFATLRAALGGEAANTPEIVAIFQQIKNLRESDRSLRSIRRNLELDNMPVIEPEEFAPMVETPPASELTTLLESFLELKKEKEQLSDRLVKMIATADQLEAKVNHLTQLVEKSSAKLGE
ncbi:MAG: hypothetical protein JWM80_1638 [Cyanobacteria bacterium RYN_339]|nr:hypothetical protein [Cyanobacteria bacterium RYN_339]